jgi:hypothetical protein
MLRQIFDLLPQDRVSVRDLPAYCSSARDRQRVAGVFVEASDLVAPKSTDRQYRCALAHARARCRSPVPVPPLRSPMRVRCALGSRQDYYDNPQYYRPIFHETVAPYTSVLVNGMYWDRRYPRLLTTQQLQELQGTARRAWFRR